MTSNNNSNNDYGSNNNVHNPTFITGYSVRAPSSSNVADLYQNLLEAKDMTSNTVRYEKGHRNLPPRTGTIPDIHKFDNEFFKLNLKQTQGMDVGIRLLLEVTQEALLDAKINVKSLQGSKTGVFIGHCFSDYFTGALFDPSPTGYEIVNGCQNMAANRISFFYDLKGPSMTINTACSSSMTALDMAMKQIQSGEIDRAIVGGLSITTDPRCSALFNAFHMLSPTGQCRAFDVSANGYCRSEGVGVVMLESARVCNNGYSIVRGTGSNCDGYKEKGITFPSSATQAELIQTVMKSNNIDKDEIGYIEAHGTGTVVGDASEINALDSAIPSSKASKPIPIGSIKSSLGHTEGASGIMGIIKVLLMFEHKKIFPNLHYTSTNHGPLVSGKFKVVSALEEWQPQTALVCNYGFGGTNAVTILSPGNVTFNSASTLSHPNNNCSFYNSKEPTNLSSKFDGWFEEQILLGNDAMYKYKLAGGKQLQQASATKKLCFVLDGQGSQWQGMGQKLMETESVFHDTISRLSKHTPIDLVEMFRLGNQWDKKELTVLGLVSYQLALIETLKSKGIKPDLFCGHSLGEIVCAYLAGFQTEQQTIEIACIRAFLAFAIQPTKSIVVLDQPSLELQPVTFQGTTIETLYYCDKDKSIPNCKAWYDMDGLMATIQLPLDDINRTVQELNLDQTSVACNNGPNTQTVTGPKTQVQQLIDALKTNNPNVFIRELSTGSVAYHSHLLKLFAPVLQTKLSEIHGADIDHPMPDNWLSTSGSSRFDSTYHMKNMTGMVRFQEAISKLDNDTICVEIGPNSGLNSLIRRNFPSIKTIDIAKKNVPEDISSLPMKLWREGVAIMKSTQVDRSIRYPTIYRYPNIWDHSRDQKVFTSLDYYTQHMSQSNASNQEPATKIISPAAITNDANKFTKSFDLVSEWSSLRGHIVNGRVLFPAVGYVFLLWEWNSFEAMPIKNLKIHKPLIIPASMNRLDLHIEINKETVTIYDNDNNLLCSCEISSHATNGFSAFMKSPTTSDDNSIPDKQFYAYAKKFGLQYEGSFQGLKFIDFNTNCGILKEDHANWISYLDTLLHPLILDMPDQPCAPVGFGSVLLSSCHDIHNANMYTCHDTYLNRIGNNTVTFDHCELQPMKLSLQTSSVVAAKQDFLVYGLNKYDDAQYLGQVLQVEGKQYWNCESNDFTRTVSSFLEPYLSCARNSATATVAVGSQINTLPANIELVVTDQKILSSDVVEIMTFQDDSSSNAIFLYRINKNKSDNVIWTSNWKDVQTAKCPVWWINSKHDESVMAPTRSLKLEGWPNKVHAVQVTSSANNINMNDPIQLLPDMKLKLEKLQMAMNYVTTDGKQVGCVIERPLKSELSDTPIANKFHLTIRKPGDMESFEWVSSNQSASIQVDYAALNFRDVMRAYGKLNEIDMSLGLEFSGHTADGQRVCGIGKNTIGSTCVPSFMYPVPEFMTNEEAATIPVVYLTAYYALFEKAHLEKGQSVLIHAGAGGVGMAAIQICLNRGIEVYTTCSELKRNFLKERFGLNDDHIFNSRSISFRDELLTHTKGKGVDCVLNSLAGPMLVASLECVSSGGTFLEIGKYDILQNSSIGLKAFEHNVSLHVIDLLLMLQDANQQNRWTRYLDDGFQRGEIVPLPAHVFTASNTVSGFRFLSQAKHIGKVLIKFPTSFKPSRIVSKLSGCGQHLITGGLGGFALELAKRLANRGCDEVVLCCRSGAKTAWQRYQLQQLQQRCKVQIVQSNVQELNHQGAIDTIWHTCTIYEDSLFHNMNESKWNNVRQPKVEGYKQLRSLYPSTRIVCFSSVAAGHGHAGQTNYAAANESMELLASRDTNSLCIQWGGVDNVGKAMTMDLARHETKYGLENIDRLLDFLDTVENKTGVVMRYNLKKVPVRRNNVVKSKSEVQPTKNQMMKHAETSKFPSLQDVCEHLALVLGGTAEDYDSNVPLLGVDSLSVMEIIGWINQRSSKEVTASFVSESITPLQIHEHIKAHPITNVAPNNTLQENSSSSLQIQDENIIALQMVDKTTQVSQETNREVAVTISFNDIQDQLALILGGNPEEYDRDTTLLGIDSLSAMELVGWVNKRSSKEVTASFVTESLTPGAIYDYLKDHPLQSSVVPETEHKEECHDEEIDEKEEVIDTTNNLLCDNVVLTTQVSFEDVQQQLSLVLGGSADDYSRNTTLLGIDSLSAMELVGWLNKRCSQEVTASFISESLTPGDIYQYLSDHPIVSDAIDKTVSSQVVPAKESCMVKISATNLSKTSISNTNKKQPEMQTVNGCKTIQIQLGRTLDEKVFQDFDAALKAMPDLIIITQQHPQIFNEGLPLRQINNDKTSIAMLIDSFVQLCTNLTAYKGMVACYINGIVRGGGMAFLGLADVCYCTAESSFGFPEVQHNMIPAVVSSVLSKRTKNCGRFNSYLISGKSFDSSVAISLGLCDEVTRKDQWNESQQQLMKRASLCAFMKKEDVLNSTDPRSMGTAMGAFLTSRDNTAQLIKARQSKENKILDLSWNGQIAILAMNDTNGKNTLSKEMALELKEINKKIQGARCIVLHSSLSNIFHVGASPSHFRSMKGKSVCMSAAMIRSLYEPWLAFYNLNIPVVAIVHGKVYGGGLPIALWADYKVAVSDVDAHFGNISRGMSPAAQLSTLLKDNLAPGAVMDLYLGNKHWDAQNLHQQGLVQQVTETKVEALKEAMAMASFIASKEPSGIKNTLDLVKTKQRQEIVNLEAWLIAEAAVKGHVFTQSQSSSNQSIKTSSSSRSLVCMPTSVVANTTSIVEPIATPLPTEMTKSGIKESITKLPTNFKYGIVAMAPYTSNYCITNKEMENGGLTPSRFRQKAVSVWDVNEDAISMALNATKKLLGIMKANGIDRSLIRRIEVGSESNTDMAKSIKSHVMQLFPNNNEMEGVDNVSACYGGTAALLNTLNWLRVSNNNENGNDAYGIVIATDTAYMDKADMCWQGCGAMAMLVGPNPAVEIHPQTVTYMNDGDDFYQPRFSDSLSPVLKGRESMEAYIKALHFTSNKMKERYGVSLGTVDHVAVHGGLHKGVIDRALNEWTKWENLSRSVVLKKYDASTKHAELVGAQYTASLYFNLHSILENSDKMEPYEMLLFSFGSGCASTMFSATVVNLPMGFEELKPQLMNRTELTHQQTCDILDHHATIRTSQYNHNDQDLLPIQDGCYQRSPNYLVTKQYCLSENVPSNKIMANNIIKSNSDVSPKKTNQVEQTKPIAAPSNSPIIVAEKPHNVSNPAPKAIVSTQSKQRQCTYGLVPAWSSNIELVLNQMNRGKRDNLIDLSLTDETMDGRTVTANEQQLINFGLCSYSGLHLHPNLIKGAKDAMDKYGVQFSCSRAYMSTPLNTELEGLMDQMTGGYTMVAQTTTLIHMAVMPTFIHENDVVLIDRQAHASIQMVAKILRCHGTIVKLIPHNSVQAVERELQAEKRNKVWYLADGIYSMYGDFAPLDALSQLQSKYPNFHLYVDDAHGISWYGKNGRGFALDFFNPLTNYDRVIVVSSLSKAFGAGGGLAVFPKQEMREKVLRVGGPMVFGGPLQNPVLGALIESTKIHLSDEINTIQDELGSKIDLCSDLLHQHGLPVVSNARIPIRFVGCGPLSVAKLIAKRLKARGFLVNVASFPAVPMDKSGIRFTIHNRLEKDDIRNMIEAMAEIYPEALQTVGQTMQDVFRRFGLDRNNNVPNQAQLVNVEGLLTNTPVEIKPNHKSTLKTSKIDHNDDAMTSVADTSMSTLTESKLLFDNTTCNLSASSSFVSLNNYNKEIVLSPLPKKKGLVVKQFDTIHDIDSEEWDKLIGNNSTTDSKTLALLESCHASSTTPFIQKWKFHYIMVRDEQQKCILATFFTECLWKDDMMASENISIQCEAVRAEQPLHHTSRVLMMGSMFTLGDALYIDRSCTSWQKALKLAIEEMHALQKHCGAKLMALQLVDAKHADIAKVLEDEGFVDQATPNLFFSKPLSSEESWLQSLKKGYRDHVKKHVYKTQDLWDCRLLNDSDRQSKDFVDHLVQLYHNVHGRARKFNTFPLMNGMIRDVISGKAGWEVILVTKKGETLPKAFVACAKRETTYAALFCGIDYNSEDSSDGGAYRHMLYNIVVRARELGYYDNVQMGFTADREKKRVGCVGQTAKMWIRIEDKDLEGEEFATTNV